MVDSNQVTHSARALVVDDDPMCRRLFTAVLQAALGEVHVAASSSGSDAICRLAASPFNIVLTDLHLPGASGIEVARTARRLNPSAVIVVATGAGSTEDEAEALAAGASSWLTKPFDVDQLIAFLRLNAGPPDRRPELARYASNGRSIVGAR